MTTERPNIQTKAGQEKLREMGIRPIPDPDDLTRPYWEAAKRHELRLQRCKSCSSYIHPPAPNCPDCSGSEMEWALVSGHGTVYAFIIDHRLMVPGFNEPYVVAQINPVEAQSDLVRITANILDCDIHDVYVGMPVEVFFVEVVENVTLPQFRPAADAKLASKGQGA